jgi:hypothetical protein
MSSTGAPAFSWGQLLVQRWLSQIGSPRSILIERF